MKKLMTSAACLAMTAALGVSAFAAGTSDTSQGSAARNASGYTITVNGKALNTPQRTDTLVPVRAVGEAMHFTVTWNPDQTVTLDSGAMHAALTIGENSYQAVTSINGAAGATGPFQLESAPIVVNGSTYVPAELFRILLGNSSTALTVSENTIAFQRAEEPEDHTQIPNPWQDYNSEAALQSAAAFSLRIPAFDGWNVTALRAIPGEIAEIGYTGGSDTVSYRVSPGSGDNSGVYTRYETTVTRTVSGTEVTMKGDGSQISLALWEKDGVSFSLYTENGLSESSMTALVRSAL